MKSSFLPALLAAAIVILVALQGEAQSSSNEWQFAIAPYLWAAGMDGTMTIADREADIDVPFSDIIDNLDLAFMGHFDMRNERWMLASDLIFVDLEDSEEQTNGTVTAGLKMTLLEAWGGYRISPAVTLLAGARWVDMSASIRFIGDRGIVENEADAGPSWIDPLIGIHVFAPLSDRWWFGGHGDVGGFGVGSELTWQVYADIGWKASDLISIILGYRALDIDYEDGSGIPFVGVDVAMTGPQLGVAFIF
jgi:hypothetical protein